MILVMRMTLRSPLSTTSRFSPSSSERKTANGNNKRYAIPTERAFDLANHFAEWAGFDCNYNQIPTSSARRDFIKSYLESFHSFKGDPLVVNGTEVQKVMDEVDYFRGLPGFYWGIWA